MSESRGGFFSLSRLLGKKHRNEKNAPNSLSKTSTQTLSRSTSNSQDVSPQNKIVPLAAVHNAPFEQTFRITVYLPLGQLYVTRIGAKTKLSDLLSMICINKLLDSKKFEFRHPSDDTEIFDLNLTIGEVGLSEVKLVHKNSKADDSVKYRSHFSSQESRSMGRPHTMSSMSPYSSTNSLNSSDSLGIVINHRVTAPGRKKRIAPRPPSQNSIPEDPEKNSTRIDTKNEMQKQVNAIHETGLKRSNLLRQNFYVSSPNLSSNGNIVQKSSSNHTLYAYSTTPKEDAQANETVKDNGIKMLQNCHFSNDIESLEASHQPAENPTCISNLPRKSSESSNKDTSLSDAYQIKRSIGKKKAPAPPPRTVSIAPNGSALQKLNGEELVTVAAYSAKANKLQLLKSNPVQRVEPTNNVSKVMLNVPKAKALSTPNEEMIGNDHNNEFSSSGQNETWTEETTQMEESLDASEIVEKYSKSNNIITKMNSNISSVVGIPSLNNDAGIDQDDISSQIDEIIDKAVKINEARLNAENHQKNKTNNGMHDQIGEINNNNGHFCIPIASENEISKPKNNPSDKPEPKYHFEKPETMEGQPKEFPIQPIFNETRTFDFHECSDNSLPTSTTSTLNTMEIPSTGPESLITSDIEDGYKGNDLEKKRKIEHICEDSKEDFIESQFGFLKEHLDNRANNDSDDERTIGSIKRGDLISSTLIADKFSETYNISSSPMDKSNIINELTHIISCNRLDTIIKPNINDLEGSVAIGNRNSLDNFQIGSYSNNHKSSLSKVVAPNDYVNGTCKKNVTKGDTISNQLRNQTGKWNTVEAEQTETLQTDSKICAMQKQIGRSMSFHSTFVISKDSKENGESSNIKSSTLRSVSNVSLFRNSGPENQNTNTFGPSIADTPSLQSIEVMKTILNCTLSKNPDWTAIDENIQVADAAILHVNDSQREIQRNEESNQNNSMTNNKKKKSKTFIYQGPPSINLSTWGERPKSLVHIKSDNDYIVGGSSKEISVKRQSSEIGGIFLKDSRSSDEFKSSQPEKYIKLPIVRSVEFKKKKVLGDPEDTPDYIPPEQTVNSFRSNYEISRILPHADQINVLDRNANSVHGLEPIEAKSCNYDPTPVYRALNNAPPNQALPKKVSNESYIDSKKNIVPAAEKSSFDYNSNENVKIEKPIYSQFTLRKTGFKEKMIDACNFNSDSEHTSNRNNVELKKSDHNYTASPLKTILKPSKQIKPAKNISANSDPRVNLLDSIRGFNRETLKKHNIN